ncbi:MAG: hypothetical protein FLDDKLPJ_02153 [Phycisphaerae bacterium]|nr:hypothetical protein [Phycisphaerae bacterium]
MVGENQHDTGVEVQPVQLVVQVVVEEPVCSGDAGVVLEQADVKAMRGLSDDRQKVARRHIHGNDPGPDGIAAFEFADHSFQPVLAPGDQHKVDAFGGELSGEGFVDPGRSARHHDPGAEAGLFEGGEKRPSDAPSRIERP